MEASFDSRAIQSLFEFPDQHGVFSESLKQYFLELGSRRPAVVLAFAPKVGGTFLREAILRASGGDLVRIVHALGGRDAQPYLPILVAYYVGGVTKGLLVAHVHLQAFLNVRLLEAFDLRPIIMIRKLPDMLASFWDMLDSDEDARRQGLNCGIPAAWLELSAERKADFLVDMLGPWYASYFGTWLNYAKQNADRVCILSYTQFCKDSTTALFKLFRHSRIPTSRFACQRAIDETWVERHRFRYNRGEEGRGARYFTASHTERLARMLSFYPGVEERLSELL